MYCSLLILLDEKSQRYLFLTFLTYLLYILIYNFLIIHEWITGTKLTIAIAVWIILISPVLRTAANFLFPILRQIFSFNFIYTSITIDIATGKQLSSLLTFDFSKINFTQLAEIQDLRNFNIWHGGGGGG